MALAAIALAACGGHSSHAERVVTIGDGGAGNDSASGGVGGEASNGVGANGGRGGTSGSGGMDTPSCVDPDATGLGIGPDPRGYGTPSSTTARNGTFVDTCDENGDLVEHYCFFDRCFVEDCGENYDALTEVIECPAGCEDGACLTWCPPEGPLLVASVDDEALILEHDSGQRLMCTVDWSADGYDCSSSDLVGETLHAAVSSACEPIFRLQLNDLEVGGMHECELLCHGLP